MIRIARVDTETRASIEIVASIFAPSLACPGPNHIFGRV